MDIILNRRKEVSVKAQIGDIVFLERTKQAYRVTKKGLKKVKVKELFGIGRIEPIKKIDKILNNSKVGAL